jgi:CBS domain containing-hemolysin-like protein
VLSEVGRSPEVGDRAELPPLRLEVKEVDGNRIRELLVEVVPERSSTSS